MSKTIREHISNIQLEKSNIEHIATTGQINGSLLISIEKAIRDYSQSQTQELTDWKESMMKVHSELDLIGIGTALELPLGSSIAPQVLPRVKELIEQNAELVANIQLLLQSLDYDALGVMSELIIEDLKELLTKYNHLNQKP